MYLWDLGLVICETVHITHSSWTHCIKQEAENKEKASLEDGIIVSEVPVSSYNDFGKDHVLP